jgi:class 3 adenylate cyclase
VDGLPLYLEWLSHVLVGVAAAMAGVLAHRAWVRRRWRRAPAATVNEAVLAVDIVNSTGLAAHHGDATAMRARNLLERRALAAARRCGASFVETTGDGCMMTFPSAGEAVRAAAKLMNGLDKRPPDLSPGPALEVRAGITYGEILLDARGARHGSAINEAFRLMNVRPDAFVEVPGEDRADPIPDRNRVFLDEDAAHELDAPAGRLRQVGVCQLAGFNGFHRVFELCWKE